MPNFLKKVSFLNSIYFFWGGGGGKIQKAACGHQEMLNMYGKAK